jgi:hypothetical protein
VGPRCHPAQRSRQRARLARVTRGAATRKNRGIVPRPTETTCSLPPQPMESPSSACVSDATSQHVSDKANKPSRKAARLCKDSARNPG